MISLSYQSRADPEKGDRPTTPELTLIPTETQIFVGLSIENSTLPMQTGTIARLTEKGFGFISREGQEKDLFFHSNELVGSTVDARREGDKVTGEGADAPKGPNAIKVS